MGRSWCFPVMESIWAGSGGRAEPSDAQERTRDERSPPDQLAMPTARAARVNEAC